MNHEIQMWSISRDIHASKLCNWSDQPSRGNWPGSEHRGLTVRNLLFVWVVSHDLSFNTAERRGRCMGARGFRVFKKLRKLKMKTRQYHTDEAGDYGDAVPVLLEILHNYGFGYKVKMAAGVFRKKCRNTESKNTTNKWVHGFYFTLIMVA